MAMEINISLNLIQENTWGMLITLAVFHHILLPIAYEFEPDLVLVSAGFDSARGDPKGLCDVTPEGYHHLTRMLMNLANGRVVIVLEGGYNLSSVEESMCACTSSSSWRSVPTARWVYDTCDRFNTSAYTSSQNICTPYIRPCSTETSKKLKRKSKEEKKVEYPSLPVEYTGPGIDCQDIKSRGLSEGDGLYWLDPDAGSHSNAFLAYCDMTSYNGGWTMCYTTDEYVNPKTEVTYSAQFPYGRVGYRTNCNNISFTEIIFSDHQTGNKTYFTRQTAETWSLEASEPITAADNYGKDAGTYGLWDGVGAVDNLYSYQLLLCDEITTFSGFFVSGFTRNCFKKCIHWCDDTTSPYFRTSSAHGGYQGVVFNKNGHANIVDKRLMSVGLRMR
ncbi:calcium ion binding [Desmophyllum pertusum]|uniref:Calcium ion binding n=1 Tax=Desmophyllum pertusum TaxID=174260 RepID=A0A9W9YUI7_9CNID|nr:calcium ion binding [Desmophyllum pertusum]